MINYISLNIKALREKHNLNQKDFGRLFDIKTQAISHCTFAIFNWGIFSFDAPRFPKHFEPAG